MTIDEILKLKPDDAVTALSKKSTTIPKWEDLQKIYEVKNHPIFDALAYPDKVENGGSVDKMTRVSYSLPKLVVGRMTGWCFGIPVKRIYDIRKDNKENDEKARALIESIYRAVYINSINMERFEHYFAECEVLTLWFATEAKKKHFRYGVESNLKIRCRTYSPALGHSIYPLFDESGDYVAVSIVYSEKHGDETIKYHDTYTDTLHIQYVDRGDGWVEELKEDIKIEKNPTIYVCRKDAIYSDIETKVYEIEWSTSRAGNYLRKNTSPFLHIAEDEGIESEEEESTDHNSGDKKIFQTSKGGDLKYVTWELNKGALEYYNNVLRDMSFSETQMPDISFEKMRAMQLSGVGFDRVFIDAHLKVLKEGGIIIESLDRETNVVKEYAKVIDPSLADTIDRLIITNVITPFTIKNEAEEIQNINLANGNKAIMSQLESIEKYGKSRDPQATLAQIQAEEMGDATEAHE